MDYNVYALTEKVKTFIMLSKEFIEDSEVHKIENLNKENKTRNLNSAVINLHARLRPLEKCLSEIKEYISQYDPTI